MDRPNSAPRILIVTPEVTCIKYQTGAGSRFISARAGGLGDICASQMNALVGQGLDVHLALPNYRNVFECNARRIPDIDMGSRQSSIPGNRIHLAQDRSFYYRPKLFTATDFDNVKISLAFQREVINRIIPEVQPDLIHCYDWMTGLIPAMARKHSIDCLFSLYRLRSPGILLSTIEEMGIDAASFWQNCYYLRMPIDYQETRNKNPLDLLTSGMFAADMVATMSSTYRQLLTDEKIDAVSSPLKTTLRKKEAQGDVATIASIPDPSFNPKNDLALQRPYEPETHYGGKLFNKLQLQENCNLSMDSTAPLCFWPTRLDSNRFGCQLIITLLPDILQRFRRQRLQIVFVADGNQQRDVRRLVKRIGASDRVAVCDFDAGLHRLAYGASDFVLMPLKCDPCALPCRIGQRYGVLPIAHDAGAIHDCVEPLNLSANTGNGFLFEHFDANGLMWAMDQAMAFFGRSVAERSQHVKRIMVDSMKGSDSESIAMPFIHLYQQILESSSDKAGRRFDWNGSSHIAA